MKTLLKIQVEILRNNADDLFTIIQVEGDGYEPIKMSNSNKKVVVKATDIIQNTINLFNSSILPNFNKEGLNKIRENINK